MSNSIKDALKKLYYKMTGKKSNKESISDVIDDITKDYEGGKTYTGSNGILVNNETNEISLTTPKYRYYIYCGITFKTYGYGRPYGSLIFTYESNILYQNAEELFDKVRKDTLDIYEWKLGDGQFHAKGLVYFCGGFQDNKYRLYKHLIDCIQFYSDKENKTPTVLMGWSMSGEPYLEETSGQYIVPEERYDKTWDGKPNIVKHEEARIYEVGIDKVEILH